MHPIVNDLLIKTTKELITNRIDSWVLTVKKKIDQYTGSNAGYYQEIDCA